MDTDYYATLISTIGSSRLTGTRYHLDSMGIRYAEDLQPSERGPIQTNTDGTHQYALTRWEAFTYKQTDVNAITTRRHLEVLQHALDYDLFPHLILEDDVRFTSKSDFEVGIQKAMTTKYPWRLFLFSCVTHPIFVRVPLGFSKLYYVPTPLMAHAYLIQREGAQRLVDLSEKYDGLAYDKLFRYLGRCVSMWPEVAYQSVNPHQLQAFTRRETGSDWLLTMTGALTISITVTILLVSIGCVGNHFIIAHRRPLPKS